MKSDRVSADPSSSLPVSRRRAVRLAAPAELAVTLSDTRISARAVDIGLGGLALLTNARLERGVTHWITLQLGTRAVTCEARVAHTRRGDDGHWLVGLAFVRDDGSALVDQFVDELTASQIEFS